MASVAPTRKRGLARYYDMRELEGVSTMTCKNVPALWENINHLKEMGIGQMSTPYRRQKYISSLL
jgi:hypothetical protein